MRLARRGPVSFVAISGHVTQFGVMARARNACASPARSPAGCLVVYLDARARAMRLPYCTTPLVVCAQATHVPCSRAHLARLCPLMPRTPRRPPPPPPPPPTHHHPILLSLSVRGHSCRLISFSRLVTLARRCPRCARLLLELRAHRLEDSDVALSCGLVSTSQTADPQHLLVDVDRVSLFLVT